ncbi:MAG: hypothetical protein ILA39_00740 [Bacteroidaceae bacterium]|nr:hypothetical protein [Bacteroidaceae bacterium]
MVRRKRHSVDEKVNILALLYSGDSRRGLSLRYKIDKKDIRLWDIRFKTFGLSGLEPLKRCSIPGWYRQEVLEEYEKGGISMRQLAVEKNICLSTLQNWLRRRRREQENGQRKEGPEASDN